MEIEVLAPGLFTTVQDPGRNGYARFGISACGAADPLSLRIGNALLGNSSRCAALEMTLVGGNFRFTGATHIVLAGADFGCALDGAPVPSWTDLAVEAGQRLVCGRTRNGARCYLCVRGGLDLPVVLGSRSTHVPSGIGGLDGRTLRKGDVLPVAQAPVGIRRSVAAQVVEGILFRQDLRIAPGPHPEWFDMDALARFSEMIYGVTDDWNRAGLRLSASRVRWARQGQLLTQGVTLGAIQIPPSGEPIVLFVDQQTTGGYPILANVISADLPALGQLKPRDRVSFELVTIPQALALLAEQEEEIRRALV